MPALNKRRNNLLRVARAGLVWVPLWSLILACGLSGSDDDAPPPPQPAPVPVQAPPAQPGPPQNTNPIAQPAPTPNRNLGCIASSAVNSTMNPVELYTSMATCARADHPDDALFLYALGGVYGRFDTYRCADETGHAAASIARMGQMESVPAPQWDEVRTRVGQMTSDPAALAAMCVRLRATGHPTYYPTYMVRHGMTVFLPNNEPPLVANFDPASAWERALDTYIHCLPVP